MSFVSAICPECGKIIEVDSEKRAGLCEHCNQPFVIEDAIQKFNIRRDENNGFIIDEDGVLTKYCGSATEIIVPDTVREIGYDSFKGCNRIISITIPENVSLISSTYAFSECVNLTSIVVNEKNENYSSIDGVLFNKEKTELIRCPIGKQDSSYTIPATVTRINQYAFSNCANLASITVPDSVKHIEEHAFRGTAFYNDPKNWENNVLYIGNHLIKAKSSWFGGCVIRHGIKNIAENAFGECEMLTSIAIPVSLTSIRSRAFSNCINLESIAIPNGVTQIGSFAFRGCTNLSSITIPDSVTDIGRHAFANCSQLTSIIIPDNVEVLWPSAFRGCTKLSSVKLSDNSKRIEVSAFRNCINLTSITIPESVTSIGKGAFEGCSNLKSVTISYGLLLKSEEAFDEGLYKELLESTPH